MISKEDARYLLTLSPDARKEEIKRRAQLYKNYDSSVKTLMNSLYGALCEKNFYFYDSDIAESITMTGQFMVRMLGQNFQNALTKNYGKHDWWITSDTDSVYISFGPVVKKHCAGMTQEESIAWLCDFADGPMKKVVRISNDKACSILKAYDPSRFDADREVVGIRGVFIKKKMYALAISDMEGVRYHKPKMKIIGLQAKKKSTPEIFRDKMEEFFRIFLAEGDTNKAISFMSDVENEFFNSPIDKIAGNFGVSDLTSKIDTDEVHGYAAGTHINAKAAITHNRLIEKSEKARREIEPIKNGTKIRIIPLKMPNPAKQPVIAWVDEWPEYFTEIGLKECIDYDLQYKKAFKAPLDRIFAACGIDPDVSEQLDIF